MSVCVALLFKAILQHPASQNKTTGGYAEFNCSVEGETVIWVINGHTLEHDIHQDKNYSEEANSSNGTVQSSLTIPCNPSNNNTVIKCVGYGNDAFTASTEATLLLQGKLSLCIK